MERENIEIYDNKCFTGRYGYETCDCKRQTVVKEIILKEADVDEKPVVVTAPRPKPEKINLRFGKVRVTVTGSEKVTVKEVDGELVIKLLS